ncbi:MAG: sigma-70 family RNA polymerase sigma factor [Pirellulales bacterium]|nr:sigma-70 family RNA polymerase sigma factor [Pirellulales bacterium]
MYDDLPSAACGLAHNPHDGIQDARPAILAIPATDGERLMRFSRTRDQAAFAEVVEAHAPMVWGVCSQILRHHQDVEDAFQATFLILARKASAIRAADSAAGWLYRVAFRTALLARPRRDRRMETPLVDEPPSIADQLAAVQQSEECFTLLEELHALPRQYREPLVLCYLEGRSRSQAAEDLGVTSQTVKGRLARGTRMLRTRLVRRGVALSAAMAAVSSSAAAASAAAPALPAATAALAAGFAFKLTAAARAAAAHTTAAHALAEKGLLAMTLAAAAKPAVGLLAVCIAAGSLTVATADAPIASAGHGGVLLAALDADAAEAPQADSSDAELALAGRAEQESDGAASIPAAAQAEPAYNAVYTPAPQPIDAPVIASAGSGGAGVLFPAAATIQPVRSPLAVSMDLADSDMPHANSEASPESLKLEAEYWSLKAEGLRLKAEALAQKAKEVETLQKQGMLSKDDSKLLEIRSDAILTNAEVKFCELNAQRVIEAREASQVGALQSGAVGPEVSRLQTVLNELKEEIGLERPLDVDGEFGPLTEEAVKKFQRFRGLKSTGVADPRTLKSLLSAVYPAWQPLAQPPYGSMNIRVPRQASERPTAAAVPWNPPAVPPTAYWVPSAPPAPAAPAAPSAAPAMPPPSQPRQMANAAKESHDIAAAKQELAHELARLQAEKSALQQQLDAFKAEMKVQIDALRKQAEAAREQRQAAEHAGAAADEQHDEAAGEVDQ